ncbi:transmembrane prolyl 4-hydroxylase-like [Glandiceps talaboti]
MAPQFLHVSALSASFLLFLSTVSFPTPSLSEEEAKTNVDTSATDNNNQCSGDSCDFQAYPYAENLPLYQIPAIKVGHVHRLELSPGKFYDVITKSVRPLLFEIPNFLTDEESEHIISLAKTKELLNSTTLEDIEEYDVEEDDIDMSMEELFKGLDENEDGYLDLEELVNSLEVAHGGFFAPSDIKEMYQDLEIDPDGDNLLNVKEFIAVNETMIRMWMDNKTESSGANKIRHSKQTWLQQKASNNPVLTALRERVIKLTRLPRNVIENSEQLQVVYYDKGGHYHAHYDSEDVLLGPNATCGQMGFKFNYHENMTYRLCRYMTILYYLNDVVEGGETAFPVADNDTFTAETLRAAGSKLYDLSSHCFDSNVVVKPEKGKAVLWYNHYVDEKTGWMGEMDNYTLHGGCDVHAGSKWIANNWINVADSPDDQAAFDTYMSTIIRSEKQASEDEAETSETKDVHDSKPEEGVPAWLQHKIEGTFQDTEIMSDKEEL